jgi:hypothetical protein
MATIGPAPERITALFLVPPDLGIEQLFESSSATLAHGGKTHEGTVTIKHYWDANISRIDFRSDTILMNDITFKKATLTSKDTKFPITFDVAGGSDGNIMGTITDPICIGTNYKLNRVTFHVPNYPDVATEECFYDVLDEGGKPYPISWSQVLLEYGLWRVAIQPYGHIHRLVQNSLIGQHVELSGVGEIRKIDGADFKPKQVLPVLESIRIFLSFAFAAWKPPLFVVGSNSKAVRSVQRFSRFETNTHWFSEGWLDEQHGESLSEAYPGFCRLWNQEHWQSPVRQAITWLIEASRTSGSTEGAIAFSQIPLEMLAWKVISEEDAILDEGEFEKLSAGNKLQLLLHECGIPLAVPSALETLVKAASEEGGSKKGASKPKSGPKIVTEIRNSIIHPNKKNREKLDQWRKLDDSNGEELLRETHSLFRWYITLVLLRLMDYQGTYANRLSYYGPASIEKVPWASTPS